MSALRVLAAHLAVAIREHRRRLTDERAWSPPELALLERWASEASRAASDRQTPTTLDDVAPTLHAPPMLLTIPAAARALDVSDRTVERLVAAGDLESVAVAGARRIPREDLERYIVRLRRAQAQAPAVPPSPAGATPGGTS